MKGNLFSLYVGFILGCALVLCIALFYTEDEKPVLEQTICVRNANMTLCLKGPEDSFKVPAPKKAEPKPKKGEYAV